MAPTVTPRLTVANPFYQPGSTRAPKVRDLFGAIARRYDLLNDLQSLGLHRRWKRRVVALARVGPGQVALDVCCGTGDVAQGLAETGPAVLALDFTLPMLAVAQRRERVRQGRAPAPVPGASLRGRGTVTALCGDALRLPLARESVDAVTICYGLRNLADFRAGLAELWRVLKPSGRLVILDFGKPDHRLWRSLYFAYLRWCVPCFGWLVCRHAAAYAYILESLIHYPAQAGVSALLRDLEAANVHVEHLLGGAMSIHCAEKPA